MTQTGRHKPQIPRFPPNCQISQNIFIYNRSNNNFMWTYMDGQDMPTLQAIQVKTDFSGWRPKIHWNQTWLQGYSSGPIPTLQTHSSGPILTLQPKNHPLFSPKGLCHGIPHIRHPLFRHHSRKLTSPDIRHSLFRVRRTWRVDDGQKNLEKFHEWCWIWRVGDGQKT